MDTVKFVKPEERYIRSYWETFAKIAGEGKYLASNEPFPYESTVAFIKDAIAKGYPQLFVIDTGNDKCVGWCDASPKTGKIGYLGMGLLPEYREQGIGKLALRQLVELSRAYGYEKIELDVRKSNTRAMHVYEALGFAATHVVEEGFVWKGTPVEEGVIQMELTL